jgi:hypothetical protein
MNFIHNVKRQLDSMLLLALREINYIKRYKELRNKISFGNIYKEYLFWKFN